MRIGLIDVDGHNFPNIPLMKLAAYHKAAGDLVEWYRPLFHSVGEPFDRVYMSKVFTFTQDFEYSINAKEIVKGGTGYFYPDGGASLSSEIEHIYPDYGLYIIRDKAYGFLSRGCPRGCSFCIVSKKEGRKSVKVADLSEFWSGQKEIVLLDPNITACPEWENLFGQLIESKAWVDFTQGVDIRLMTAKMAEMLKHIKVRRIHFAWDNWNDKDIILPKLKMFKEITRWPCQKMIVYTLTNYDTTHEQDLERIYTLSDLGYNPDVRIYEKEKTKPSDNCRRLQRWVNNRVIFKTVKRFEDYKSGSISKE